MTVEKSTLTVVSPPTTCSILTPNVSVQLAKNGQNVQTQTREEILEQELIEAAKIIKRQSERIADLEMKDALNEQQLSRVDL